MAKRAPRSKSSLPGSARGPRRVIPSPKPTNTEPITETVIKVAMNSPKCFSIVFKLGLFFGSSDCEIISKSALIGRSILSLFNVLNG